MQSGYITLCTVLSIYIYYITEGTVLNIYISSITEYTIQSGTTECTVFTFII